MYKKLLFIRICFYFGFLADLIASIPLLFPSIGKKMFGLDSYIADDFFVYITRIGASLMLGWTILLLWGSFKPIERKEILLFTVFPVLSGLLTASILVVNSGYIDISYVYPMWIFYSIVIPSYLFAYKLAWNINKVQDTI
ncbi:MAG: hypothetical protein NT007_15885 [Candidatus Kapabacteria bacterium]|nr:hypothetical protein [Candidatus Kapabacteria bacterium]